MEGGFHYKFFNSLAESTESPLEFLSRLNNYLARWLELAKVGENYEELRNLLLKEQFLKVCQKDVAMYALDKELAVPSAVAEAAAHYLQVHGGTLSGKRTQRRSNNGNQEVEFTGTCYNCGGQGYRAKE